MLTFLRSALREQLFNHRKPVFLGGRLTGPQQRVAMFHMSRCGSTVLGQMLAAQGEIFWAGEVFANMPSRYAKLMRSPDAVGRILDRSLAEPESLRSIVRRSEYPPLYRVYGCETIYLAEEHFQSGWIDMDLPDYIALLDARNFDRFIVLHRYNHLRMLVSRAVAETTGTWHSHAPAAGPVPVVLPVTELVWGDWRGSLLDRLRDQDAQHERLLQLLEGRRVLQLTYEEHISADPTIAYCAVCNFLGLQALPVAMRLRKTNPFSLQQSVRNWDEVVGALSGTEYAWMLTDEFPPPAA
jgi:LPS sulfotransferase NodH